MNDRVISVRVSKELESILAICPGSTRAAQLMSLVNFAIESGFPTCLLEEQPAVHLDDRVRELEQQIEQILQVKELADYCKWAVDKHDKQLEAIEQKLARRTNSLSSPA